MARCNEALAFARVKRRLCRHKAFCFAKYEAKRTRTFNAPSGVLHSPQGDFMFHAPQVRFISKNKSRSNDLLLFLSFVYEKEPVEKPDFLSNCIFLINSLQGNTFLWLENLKSCFSHHKNLMFVPQISVFSRSPNSFVKSCNGTGLAFDNNNGNGIRH